MSSTKVVIPVALLVFIGILISFFTLNDQYTKPIIGELTVINKGAGLGKTGGGVIEKSFLNVAPQKVADFFENVDESKVVYTPQKISVTIPVTLQNDNNLLMTFIVDANYSINPELAWKTTKSFKNYPYEMKRILEKVVQYRLSKKSFGFKQTIMNDTQATETGTTDVDIDKYNDFSNREKVADELKKYFVDEFNKTFPEYPILDTSILTTNTTNLDKIIKNSAFYLSYVSFTSMSVDKRFTPSFEKVAVSNFKKEKASLEKDIKDVRGQIEVQKAKNMTAALDLESSTMDKDILKFVSSDVILNSVENPNIQTNLILKVNDDLTIDIK